MSGPTKDLVGEPNDVACPECDTIFKGPKGAEKAARCRREHELQKLRDRCRKFARTGVSQRSAP